MNQYWTKFPNEYLESIEGFEDEIDQEPIELDKIEEIFECHLCNDHGCNYCLCVEY